MDFTGTTGFITKYSVDESTGLLTITFRDVLDTATIGEIIIEEHRSRAIFEALLRIQEARISNLQQRQSHKTLFNVISEEGRTDFV